MTTTTFLNTVKTLIDPAGFMPEIFDEPTAITPEADSLTGVTDPGFNVPDELLPSTYVIEAGETLRENGWNTLGQGVENVGQVMRSFGFDEDENDDLGGDWQKEGTKLAEKVGWKAANYALRSTGGVNPLVSVISAGAGSIPGYSDPDNAAKTSEQKIADGETSKVYHALSPLTTAEEDLAAHAHRIHHDPNASEGAKIASKIAHAGTVIFNNTIGAPIKFGEQVFRFFASLDEDEEDIPAFRDEFSSNPETLTPFNIDNALVTDDYQQQDAPGADLIAGEANQGMDPYQAQGGRYEVLA